MSVDIRSQARVVGRLDLLAVDLIGSADFYHRLFDWEFTGDFAAEEATLVRGDPDEGLLVVVTGDGVLGQTFGRKGQWEVFFDVASVDETSERAWRHGGDVLHSPVAGLDGSRLAVIRDPTGAVFGVIEDIPPGRAADATACDRGRLVGMELHTSLRDVAAEFYIEVFNWETSQDQDPSAVLFSRAGRPIAGLVADPSPVLSHPTWIAYFGVPEISEACGAVEWLGGTVLAVTAGDGSRSAALVADPGGAVFGLCEQ
jgi:predicted enzyme related to lactoylglutathione lyase